MKTKKLKQMKSISGHRLQATPRHDRSRGPEGIALLIISVAKFGRNQHQGYNFVTCIIRNEKRVTWDASRRVRRQKLYRQRHKPKDRLQEFRLKLFQLVDWYSRSIDVDAMEVMLEEFADAYSIDAYTKRFTDEEPDYIDKWYAGRTAYGAPFSKLIAQKREKNKKYQAEKDAEKAKKAEPVDPVEAGRIAERLASMLPGK